MALAHPDRVAALTWFRLGTEIPFFPWLICTEVVSTMECFINCWFSSASFPMLSV